MSLQENFVQSTNFCIPESERQNRAYTAPKHTGPHQDFTSVFVEQARLYIVTKIWEIQPLSKLTV